MDENTALIQVVQLPIITERLQTYKVEIQKIVSEANSLVCTDESIQTVKKYRANLRKQFEWLEDQRKTVKSAVMKPYNEFETIYSDCVTAPFKGADDLLKGKIDEFECEIKRRCEEGLREYFDELCAAEGLDWLTFERAGIKVDMASAKQKTPKKLREQLVKFVTGVSRDVDAIAIMDNADEILTEYKRYLDLSFALGTVSDRHRRMEEERAAREARAAQKAAEAEAVHKVEALAPPTVKVEPEKLTVTFTVRDTRERLIALREWMKANQYDYK